MRRCAGAASQRFVLNQRLGLDRRRRGDRQHSRRGFARHSPSQRTTRDVKPLEGKRVRDAEHLTTGVERGVAVVRRGCNCSAGRCGCAAHGCDRAIAGLRRGNE